MLRKTVRHYVDDRILPNIAEWDAAGGFDPEV